MIKPLIACVVVPASLAAAHAVAGTVTNLALGAPVSLVSGGVSGASSSTPPTTPRCSGSRRR